MVFRFEFKKILRIPILWFLAVVFIGFDLLFIGTNLYYKDDIVAINEAIKETGTYITETSLKTLNETTNPVVQDFSLRAAYRKSVYDGFDMISLKERKEELQGLTLKGNLKEFVDNCYEKLQTRVEQITSTNEADGGFFPGDWYRMHSFLFGTMFKIVLLQMSVLIVLSVIIAMDYDRIHHTLDIVYSSKIGRKRLMKEVMAGLLVGILISVFLFLIVFAIYFLVFPYDGVLKTPISSGLMAEVRGMLYYPYVTFVPLTVGEYFLCCTAFAFCFITLMGLLAAVMMLIWKNSYLSFLGLVTFCLLLLITAMDVKTGTLFDVLILFNPSILWIQCGEWFMESNLYTSFHGYEWIAWFFNLFIVLILLYGLKLKYEREDLLDKG